MASTNNALTQPSRQAAGSALRVLDPCLYDVAVAPWRPRPVNHAPTRRQAVAS